MNTQYSHRIGRCLVMLIAVVLLQGCATRSSDSSSKAKVNQAIDPAGLFKIDGFHQVMTSTRAKTVYIAGQVAYDENMALVGAGDYRAQTIRALQNVATAAVAAGARPEDIVSSTLYIRDMDSDANRAVMQGMATALKGTPFPAHAFNLVGVASLADPRILVEISAVAVTD